MEANQPVTFEPSVANRRSVLDKGINWNVEPGDKGTITRTDKIKIRRRKIILAWVLFDKFEGEYPRPFQEVDLRKIN